MKSQLLHSTGLLGLIGLVLAPAAHGQSFSAPERVGMSPAPLTQTAPDPHATKTFELPSLSDVRHQTAGGADSTYFTLSTINITGSTVLKAADTDRIKARYIGHPITLSDVTTLQDDLTRLLVSKGYISSGAVIGSQDVSSGILNVQIVEGRLTGIRTTGVSYLSDTYLAKRLGVSQTRVLSAQDIQSAYQLMLQNRNIAGMNAKLLPGDKVGEAVLSVDVKEAPRHSLEVFAASDRSPSVGDIRAGVRGHYARLLVPGDDISGEIGHAQGLTDGRFYYTAPVTGNDVALNIYGQASKARILDKPLNALDAISDSLYGGAGVSVPLLTRPGRALTVTTAVDHTRVRTDLLGVPFSFSAGSVNGITDYSTWRSGINYTFFSNRQSLLVSAMVSHGLGAQKNTVGVNRGFTYTDLSGQYVRVITPSGQRLILRGGARLTRSTLYATEMLALGGDDTVRGYRQNAILGNAGYWGSLEYRLPLSDIVPGKTKSLLAAVSNKTQVGFFADTGHITRPASVSSVMPRQLSSVGVRALWAPTEHIQVDVHFAKAKPSIPARGSFQDRGFGFTIGYRF